MLTRNKSHVNSSLTFGNNGQKYSTEKCRICLADGEIPIFGTNDISEDVKEFGQIGIGKDDNLPQYLCDDCHNLLEAAILFRKTAKQSDKILKRLDSIDTDESEYKLEDETYIKKEYLEFNCSDSEAESFNLDKVKPEKDETYIYNSTFSEAYNQDNDSNSTQRDLVQVKKVDDGSVNEADNETIMIIVSDKDKQKDKENAEYDNDDLDFDDDDMDFGNDDINFDNDDIDVDKDDIDFDSDEEITEHYEESLTSDVESNQRECPVCHTMVLRNEYRKHLKEHREKYKQKFNKLYGKIECEYCGKQISKAYMKIHMIKAHGTAEEKAKRFIKCTSCNRMFSKHYYKYHLLKMHPDTLDNNKYEIVQTEEQPTNYKKCPVCDRKVKEEDFKLHLEKHNGPLRRFICDKCGKVFKHPSAFKTHCLTHGGELKFKCQFCPYRGLHQALLKIHVRTHTGDYNYKCTECPARFITKSNLSKHLRRHNRQYSFKCEECDKGFYSKRDLENHTKTIHMSIRNHVCEVCGKAFGHRDSMLAHQLRVHKRDKVSKGRTPSYLKAE